MLAMQCGKGWVDLHAQQAWHLGMVAGLFETLQELCKGVWLPL
jgi:hypothetical protein